MKYSFEYFLKTNWSFVLIKNETILFKSELDGLKPLVKCIKEKKNEMQDAVVYDKIIGRAAAMLLAHAGLKEVWTPTLSRSGKEYLEEKQIKIIYKKLVDCIINTKGDGVCPMEKLSKELGETKFIEKMLG